MITEKRHPKLNIDEVLSQFSSLCKLHSFEVNDMGDGRIFAYRNGGNKTYYISSGIHGDEPAGPLTILSMMHLNLYPKDVNVLLFPCLNVEGFKNGTRSYNGLDLNRDYKKEKSNKTELHKQIVNKFGPFDMSVCLHEDWESDGFYIYEQCDNISYANDIINTISKTFPINTHKTIDRHSVDRTGIIKPNKNKYKSNWPEAIWLWKLGCPQNYTIETPTETSLKDRVRVQMKACKLLMDLNKQ